MPSLHAIKYHPALAAAMLIGVGVIGVAAMAFHPHADGAGAQARFAGLAEISPLNTHVHMLMIAAVLAGWLALSYGSLQWPSPGPAWLAERLYRSGAGAMVGAALINGFAVGDYARQMLQTAGNAMDAPISVVTFAFSLNQALAGFGTIMMSCGILVWSLGLRRSSDRLAKVACVYGVAAGATCCLAYAGGLLHLDVPGMAAVVVAHGVWYVLVGLLMLRS